MKIKKIKDGDAFLKKTADELELQPVANLNWPDAFPEKPDVKFAIAHTGDAIYLKYFVEERYTLARFTKDNDQVWTDSCVEFFIKLDDSGYYYNYEFNCIGTALLGWRKIVNVAEHANNDIMATIERYPSLGKKPFPENEGSNKWELAVKIPVGTFFKHKIKDLSGIKTTANFYKCGDDLTVPHYLSWSPIDTPNPNFHTVQFFGDVEFE